MKIGDSFLIPAATPALVQEVKFHLYREGKKYRDYKDATFFARIKPVEGGVRVWRVEEAINNRSRKKEQQKEEESK